MSAAPPPILERGPRAHWWRRRGTKSRGFHYVEEGGRRIEDPAEFARIKALVLPPAWREVRINPSAKGRIQALGLDGTGRVQYLYHDAFVARREKEKFEKIERFGEYLPELRRATSVHLGLPGLHKERVLAVVVRLINRLYFRVGSEKGVERYRTFGVTTLRNRHLKFLPDGAVEFSFDGKHHVHQRRLIVDEPIARCLWELRALRGPTLFKYVGDDGRIHPVHADDVNDYIKRATAPEFSAKDFRTWAGTILVAKELGRIGPAETKTQRKRNVAQAVRAVAAALGNTPAVCRKAYLHPVVLTAYERGHVVGDLPPDARIIQAHQTGYFPDELALLDLFQRMRRRRTAPTPPAGEPRPVTVPGPWAPTPS